MTLFALILQSSANSLLGFLPILLMFGIMYFLVLLPVQRQRKQSKEMLANLKSGDEVLTNGGLIGTIYSMNDDDTLVLRVKPDNVKLQISRGAVASLVSGSTK